MVKDLKTESVVSDNQRAFAESLGITVSDFSSIEALVEQIEKSLGQSTMLEQSRWFVMSVLCHSNRCAWLSIDESDVDKERQYEIASSYISTDDFKQSLRTVLKEDRCKFTLIRFAKSRNIEKRTLSTTTKAFKHAQSLLKELGLIKAAKARASKTKKGQTAKTVQKKAVSKTKSEQDKDSLAGRRASRRGYFDDEFLDFLNPQEETSGPLDSLVQMSDEEFAELDAKIDMEAGPVFENWSGEQSEDRTSLLVGLAAGGVMFAVVIWLFI